MIIVLNKYKILTLVVAMTLMLPVALQGAQAIEVGMLIEGFGLEQQVTKAQIDEPEKEEKAAEKQAKIAEKAAEKAGEKGGSLGFCDFSPTDGKVTHEEASIRYEDHYGYARGLLTDFIGAAIMSITGGSLELTTLDQVQVLDDILSAGSPDYPVCTGTN